MEVRGLAPWTEARQKPCLQVHLVELHSTPLPLCISQHRKAPLGFGSQWQAFLSKQMFLGRLSIKLFEVKLSAHWRNPMSHTISRLTKCLSTFTTAFSCLRIPKFCLSWRGKQNTFLDFSLNSRQDWTVGMGRYLLPAQAPKLPVDNSVTPSPPS